MFDFARIDLFLRDCNSAKDDTALRRVFASYNAAYDLDVPPDPFSEQYRQKQMAIYEQLAGKAYTPANEVTTFDVASASISPFPYCTGSCELVGNHLMAWGYLIRSLDLPERTTILEFGPGWGNTTLALAKMGFSVTAVDIEKNFCDLISERARLEHVSVNVIHGDFSLIRKMETQFDAVVFFECFHHSSDHGALMAAFDKVLKPGGKVYFGSEPITPDFPVPWGMRMDGESIWAIRKNGWYEVGFNEAYFEEAMRRNGWGLTCRRAKDLPWAAVFIGQRLSERGGTFKTADGRLRSAIGKKNRNGAFVSLGQRGYLSFGPYIDLPRGRYRGEFLIDRSETASGKIDIDVSIDNGTNVVQRNTYQLEKFNESKIGIDFVLDQQCSQTEVRIFCHEGARLGILQLDIFIPGAF